MIHLLQRVILLRYPWRSTSWPTASHSMRYHKWGQSRGFAMFAGPKPQGTSTSYDCDKVSSLKHREEISKREFRVCRMPLLSFYGILSRISSWLLTSGLFLVHWSTLCPWSDIFPASSRHSWYVRHPGSTVSSLGELSLLPFLSLKQFWEFRIWAQQKTTRIDVVLSNVDLQLASQYCGKYLPLEPYQVVAPTGLNLMAGANNIHVLVQGGL